jgi:hypothetical protein
LNENNNQVNETNQETKINLSCKKCDRKFNHINGILSHLYKTHGMTSEQVYCEQHGIIETPLCGCGCGKVMTFQNWKLGYTKFERYHYANLINASEGHKLRVIKKEEDDLRRAFRVFKAEIASIAQKSKELELADKAIKCPLCENIQYSILSMCHHWAKTHKLDTSILYLKLNGLDSPPLCKCGCKEETTFLDAGVGYREYIWGHAARVSNNYQTKKSIENSIATRRKMLKDGIWKPFMIKATGKYFLEGLTKETSVILAERALKRVSDPEVKRKASESMRKNRLNGKIPSLFGINHPQWKGGVSSVVGHCYVDKKLYKEWKFPLLKAANFQCQDCGSKDDLQVHHDKEKMNDIIRKVLKHNNIELESIHKASKRMEFKLKCDIASLVADYHVKNKVSGEVICKLCHSKHHAHMNF